MSPYSIDAVAWQESWDRQQEAYLPDREERFAALLDTVDAVTEGWAPRVLDLAGGTGSISLRVLRRFPGATTTLLDVDPVLQHIARASLDSRSAVVSADLRTPDWVTALPHREYDAVLTATALHWIAPDRLATLYAEIKGVLRPGGVFVNADHMPDDGLPALSQRLEDRANGRRNARYAAGVVLSWGEWWEHVSRDPELGPLVAERKKVFAESHSAEWTPPVSWHLDALRAAGYAEVGLVWRGALDAAVAAVA
ncbi:class I SAM-dependent methyltransferase [Actinomycetes bacterium KLBMP 9797]